MKIARLQRTSRIHAGHLWVFSNELAESPKGFEPGSLVELRDRRDAFLGIGYINPHSLIAVRILTHQKEEINADFFRKRILDAEAHRRLFLKDTDSFRVVFSEGDFLPGLIVDKYGECLCLQILTFGMERWADELISIFDDLFSPSLIVLRNDSPSRLLEGLPQEKRIVKGTLDNLPATREDSLSFEIDPMAGQKTGFFLDQRENRIAFSRLAGEGKGLDLFCYAGAWSMHLAGGGAAVTGVDDSEAALALARRNAERNGLSERCGFVKADVFEFLRREGEGKGAYDFIVLDPPAFAKSKAKVKEALRAYREINAHAMRVLREGGLLATSSCSYHIDRGSFLEMLRAAARDAGRQVRLIEMRSQARDHPILLSMPETEYLKCAFLEVRQG
jgi:23S rRNA (cytosine1962-C5)-methyltransferase